MNNRAFFRFCDNLETLRGDGFVARQLIAEGRGNFLRLKAACSPPRLGVGDAFFGGGVRPGVRVFLGVLALAPAPAVVHAQWQAVEEVRTYPVSGSSGSELYRSIGENGPTVGGEQARVIAHTTFKLTWTRKYEPKNNACVLAVAKPKLVIFYTLPRPSAPLTGPVKASWDAFMDGVRKHEHVHGETIVDMVRQIEAISVGLSAPDDPDCRKIRAELTKRLGELSARQRQLGRDFDRTEMGEGGNIQALVLKLVNGP
jgi:predicted secreted Zn-dependent protease